jgi:CubicO group peptidase (beta-lactamase class C family)
MEKFRTYPLTLLLALLLLLGCRRNDPEFEDVAEYEVWAEKQMDRQHIPAMSVLIFKQDVVLYEQTFGFANLEEQLALEADHMFLIASISKVTTATALLQLYENGRFDLDDPINDYLPYAVDVPGHARDITFRMLLTHTSAIADNDPVLDTQYYYDQDPPVSLADFMEDYFAPNGQYYDPDLNFHDFEPGTAHEYSNMGSALVGHLVERISGIDFNTYCKDSIFRPLGMEHTAWRLDEITSTIVTPYDYRRRENNAIAHYTNSDYPNGGLRTTARDLHKLVAALANGGQTPTYQLLEASTAAAMLTPQIPDIDAEVGLHMFVMNAEHGLWGHDGGEQGVATIMGFHPGTQLGVVIFTNQGEAELDDIFSATYAFGLTL